MAAVNDIQTDRCEKPLICVSKAVYKNRISEISMLFPDMKINELGNFSGINNYKTKEGALNIESGSVSVRTVEALEKIGFKKETLEGDLTESFSEALSTLTEADRNAIANKRKKAIKKKENNKQDILTKAGTASKTGGKNRVYWEDTGLHPHDAESPPQHGESTLQHAESTLQRKGAHLRGKGAHLRGKGAHLQSKGAEFHGEDPDLHDADPDLHGADPCP
jgi:hypothetical protein